MVECVSCLVCESIGMNDKGQYLDTLERAEDGRLRWKITHDDRIVAIGKFDGARTFKLICRIASEYPACRVFIGGRELVNFDYIRRIFRCPQR